jgi:3-oxoacyl-[acyl-carrier protein] reductase
MNKNAVFNRCVPRHSRIMNLGLHDARVAVTGGTRGIGAAIATAFIAEGASVSLCARAADDVEATVKRLSTNGATVLGRDIVVSSASAMSLTDTAESWQRTLAVDLGGTSALVNAALTHLRRSQAPAIVTIGSVSGREIDLPAGAYGAAKAAIAQYTKALSRQLAPAGIRVNCVCPGNTYFDGGVWNSIEERDPDHFANAIAANPFGRMARPEEIAAPVVFLASKAASFVSGASLTVDGALTRSVQL